MRIENNKEPLITVITTAYNAEKTLETSIQSVLDQTYKNFEYIVVNHGSSDTTKDIISQFVHQDRRVCLLDIPENLGCPARALNIAMEQAEGEYLCFLDADDSYMPDFLQTMSEAILSYDADVVSCSCRRLFSGNPWHGFRDRENKFDRVWKFLSLDDYRREFGVLLNGSQDGMLLFDVWWNKLYRVDFLKKNHLIFPEEYLYFSDALFHIELYKKLPRLVFTPFSGIQWNVSGTSTSYILSEKRNKETIVYVEKYNQFRKFLEGEGICRDLTKFMMRVMRAFIGLPMFRRLHSYDKQTFLSLCNHYTSEIAGELVSSTDFAGCIMGNQSLSDALSFYIGDNTIEFTEGEYEWLYNLKHAMEPSTSQLNLQDCLDLIFNPQNHFSVGVEMLLDNILEGE